VARVGPYKGAHLRHQDFACQVLPVFQSFGQRLAKQSINRPSIPPTQKTQCVAWSGLEKPKQTAAAGAGGGGAVVLLGG